MMANMLGKISIKKGPSREELFDALRLCGEKRKVIFTIHDDDGRPVELKCGISMLRPEDGSGLRWLIEVYTHLNNTIVTGSGYYDTVSRQGYVDL